MAIDVDITFSNYRCFSKDMPAKIHLGNVAALVGPNNGGKSTILRYFYDFRPLFQKLSNWGQMWHEFLNGTVLHRDEFLREVEDTGDLFNRNNQEDMEIQFEVKSTPSHRLKRLNLILNRRSLMARMEGFDASGRFLELKKGISPNPQDERSTGDTIYIGHFMQAFASISRSLYFGPIRHVMSTTTGRQFDAHLGQGVIEQWDKLRNAEGIENRTIARQLEADLAKLMGASTLTVRPTHKSTDLLIDVDGHENLLSRMGTGISQIIATLINVVLNRPSFILIDEPELNLHPSLQIKFLDMLDARSPDGLVFSTHQLGLARETADEIYTVQLIERGKSKVTNHEPEARLPELLGELSFPSLREIGFSKVLLVEGVTEIKVFRHFLKLFHKAEDFIVVSLGGDNMICRDRELELKELVQIVGGDPTKIEVVIDSERDAADVKLAKNRYDFCVVCKGLGINVKVLDRRATESYFPQHALQKAVSPTCRALAPYERLGSPDAWHTKKKNAAIASNMCKEDLDGTDLGEFLSSI